MYTNTRPRAMKRIRALSTRDTPDSLSATDFAKLAMSSGESSLVNASLKVRAAVARAVEIAPAAT